MFLNITIISVVNILPSVGSVQTISEAKQMKLKHKIIGGVGSVAAVFLVYYFMSLFAGAPTIVEYKVTSSDDYIEIRHYPAYMVAQVQVEGAREAAQEAGTKQLKEFFDGGNNFSIPIEQYAPIIIQEDSRTQNLWKISMIMPERFKVEDLPIPDNEDIKFIEIPAQSYAAISFSGGHDDANLRKHLGIIATQLRKNKVVPKSQPVFMFYSPTWALPMARTIDVMTFVPPDLQLKDL